MAVTKVNALLLCCYGDENTDIGMLKMKVKKKKFF